MDYLSTRNNKIKLSFLDILFQGLSKDGGLFLPHSWPKINLEDLKGKNYQEIAEYVIQPFVSKKISNLELKNILKKTYEGFDTSDVASLININKNQFILELFHGPTFAFKDYALQFLGNLFSHCLKNSQKKITVLGATSGDTGSAAIEAFKGKENVKVFILHPYGRVSAVQRKQMTTILDENINNIAVKGTFDDCQKIVKELFLDEELNSKTSLTAVNSINWARLIAQVVYYFWTFIKLDYQSVNFIVPSGNFGNIFSARIAKYMGLPINMLHVVTNENDILHRTIRDNAMKLNQVIETHSPSMDIQISSNFERQIFESSGRDSHYVNKFMSEFYKNQHESLSSKIMEDIQKNYKSHSVDNKETLESIKFFYKKYNYLADPHTATGLYVLNKLNSNEPNVSLACAHPAKFEDAIEKAIQKKPNMPHELKKVFDKEEKMIILDNDSNTIKSHIYKII